MCEKEGAETCANKEAMALVYFLKVCPINTSPSVAHCALISFGVASAWQGADETASR